MWRTYKSYKLNYSIYVLHSKEDSTTTVLELQTMETPTTAPPSYHEAIGLNDNYNAPLLGPATGLNDNSNAPLLGPAIGLNENYMIDGSYPNYNAPLLGPVIRQPRAGDTDASHADSKCCHNCGSCFECFIDICTCICCCFAGC